MTYQLGIDFGTTTVAAAIHRPGAQADIVPLGGTGATVPAVLHLARDGRATVGDGASRRAGIDPGRVVRALKRQVGDPTPIVVGRESWTAEELTARVVRWVVDRVAEREGGPAGRVVLAHPATWSAHTLERLESALAGQDVPVIFVAEPQAVAMAHAVPAGGKPGDTVAVYDLGAGRFDAAVLRRGDVPPGPPFELLGRPEGLADVGGLDIDELLWEHVRAGLPEGVVPDARLRRAIVRAKETLSTKTEVVVRVRQGERAGEVRLHRGTLEQLIAPHVARTVAVLQRVVASAGLAPADLDAVLVVGGASRIPLVARTVSAQLGRAVSVLDAPELLVARGAALTMPVVDGLAPVACQQGDAADAQCQQGDTAGAQCQQGDTADAQCQQGDTADAQCQQGDTADIPAEPPASPVTEPAADADFDAPTVAFPVPTSVDAATTPYGTPVVTPKAAPPEPAAGPEVARATGGTAGIPAAVAASEVEATEPDPAPSRPVRFPAVLEAGARRGSRRSLPRLLIGAGAVVVAALVLVALFRADGPLDPPLDPAANEATRVTGAPVVPAPVPTTGTPAVEGLHADSGAEGLRAGDAAAAIRVPGPVRARASDDHPADALPVDPPRSAVDTTPPPAPTLRTTGAGTAPRDTVDRAEGAPIGAAPRTPPTPAAPLA